MPRYTDLRDNAERLRTAVVDGILKPIAFHQFKEDRGTAVNKVLPDKSDIYDFETEFFRGNVDPDRREFYNAEYKDGMLTTGRITAQPTKFNGLGNAVCNLWWETFGEFRKMSTQPSHPGEPTMDADSISMVLDEIEKKRSLVAADPLMEDLVKAVQDKNHRTAAQFLNLDVDPMSLFTPGGTHELTELFTNGEIHVVYQDRDIALLKPEYNHGLRRQVLNDQRTWGRVRLQGEQPEIAFVVGIDDTPTGLFVHSVDGTRLDEDQDVSRDYIHDVMGFDVNYQHQSVITSEKRVRIQGDLAIERVDDSDIRESDRCNLPIDNHLAMLNRGQLPSGETRESEPIQVNIPDMATLNVMHDEHDNISAELKGGQYRFYLLPRGLQPPSERPNWPEP